MTIRVLIVDDEPAARRGLRRKLEAEPDLTVIGECGDGESAIAFIEGERPDLVFLDIQMPESDGFDVVEAVGATRMPAIVFVTAFDEHALRAFDIHAVDYVLKPVEPERLRTAIERARSRVHSSPDRGVAAALNALGRGRSQFPRRIAIRTPERITLLDVREVDYLSSAGNYVEVHAAGKTHLVRETLADMETRCDPDRFVRISRSAIVSIDRIRELRPMFNGDCIVVLRDGTELPASRRYRARLDAISAP